MGDAPVPPDGTPHPLAEGAAPAAPGPGPAFASPQAPAPHRPRGHRLAGLIATGVGSGLVPAAPGTAGTLWAWACHAVLSLWLTPTAWGVLIGVSLLGGWWACTVTADTAGRDDPGFIVWDEIVAFWIVLWLITPCGFGLQLLAFVLFRVFDALKPGPVGWADRAFKGRGWRGGFGILFDDLVAAGCTLLVIAAGLRLGWLG